MQIGKSALVTGLVVASVLTVIGCSKVTEATQRGKCRDNLRMIDAAKSQQAMAYNYKDGAVVSEEVVSEALKGNFGDKNIRNGFAGLVCPAGGRYTINVVGKDASCSVHGSKSDLDQTIEDTIPRSVRRDANRAFAEGKLCYLWRDAETKVMKLEIPMGGNAFIIGQFRVIGSPSAKEPVIFEPRCDLSVSTDRNETRKVEIHVGVAAQPGVKVLQTTGSHQTDFGLMIQAVSTSPGSRASLSGKGTITIVLTRPKAETNAAQEISNPIRFIVDLEKEKILE